MPPAARKLLAPAAWVAAVTAALLLVFPLGFPNYDTIYALVWGRELAHGMSPDYGAALPPTPHPLADLLGLVTTPLGDGAITVTMVVAYASLGLVGYLVYRLGSLWFDRPIGAVAALIVLTRAPFLSNGLRAYVDLPYIALCLGALVIETRRPRAGWPVLALLALAGLLRPEAWLFSVAYLACLALSACERVDRELAACALARRAGVPARAAPGWRRSRPRRRRCLGAVRLDHRRQPHLLVHRHPRHGRDAGAPDRPGRPRPLRAAPARRGAAVAGDGRRRRRRRPLPRASCAAARVIGVAAALLALGAFALLACAGLAIIPRYTMLAAAVLAVFAAAALLGWRLLEPGQPWRRRLAGIRRGRRADVRRLGPEPVRPAATRRHRPRPTRARIEGDLDDLADSGAFEPLCLPISVPNHRAVPRLAFDLDIRPRGSSAPASSASRAAATSSTRPAPS